MNESGVLGHFTKKKVLTLTLRSNWLSTRAGSTISRATASQMDNVWQRWFHLTACLYASVRMRVDVVPQRVRIRVYNKLFIYACTARMLWSHALRLVSF